MFLFGDKLIKILDRFLVLLLLLFPYHSSVVQVPSDAFASGALFNLLSRASEIISLPWRPVNRFFTTFVRLQKNAFIKASQRLSSLWANTFPFASSPGDLSSE
jgi:hypothetical protein